MLHSNYRYRTAVERDAESLIKGALRGDEARLALGMLRASCKVNKAREELNARFIDNCSKAGLRSEEAAVAVIEIVVSSTKDGLRRVGYPKEFGISLVVSYLEKVLAANAHLRTSEPPDDDGLTEAL